MAIKKTLGHSLRRLAALPPKPWFDPSLTEVDTLIG